MYQIFIFFTETILEPQSTKNSYDVLALSPAFFSKPKKLKNNIIRHSSTIYTPERPPTTVQV